MEDISKLKAPKNLKLSKPRPRTKDVNQNNVQVNQLNHENYYTPVAKSHHRNILIEENYDLHGDTLERGLFSEFVQNSYQLDDNGNKNGNICMENGKDSETSSVCSKPDEINANTGNGKENRLKMTAPRKVKLMKPRPLRSSKADENGNESNKSNGNTKDDENIKDADIITKITAMIHQLRQGTLSVNDCLHFRDLLAVHCPHLEIINKAYIDSCFNHIEDVLREKTLDKMILVSLRDLIALRQRAWQPYPKPSSTRKKSITWNDISEEIHYKDCMLYDSNIPLAQKQMSLDSGIGDPEDQVLWDTEEAFEEDLTTEILSEYNKTRTESKERSQSPFSVIEAVQGLKIVGEDEEYVKAAAELLQKYMKNQQQIIAENKNDKKETHLGCKDELKNNVIRQPIGPGTSDRLMKEVEEILPDGRNTAKGRRTMFKTYSNAMSITDHDVQKMECIPKPYSRDELLYLSLSALSKKCPPELSYLSKVFPDVCFTEVDTYFHKDDLTVKDLSWGCPVLGQRRDYSSTGKDGEFTDSYTNKAGFGPRSLRRGFSCPSGDLEADSHSSRSGFDNKNPRYGAPAIRRGFSCPMGDSDNYNRDGSFTVDSDSSEDSSFTRSGFMKRSTSFENKSYGFNDKKQDCKEFKSDKKGFGSPSDKQGFNLSSNHGRIVSPAETQVVRRNGFGTPINSNSVQRRSSLSAVENISEQWDV